METVTPKVMSGHITSEEYEHVMKQNVRISRELQKASGTAEWTNEALRHLAARKFMSGRDLYKSM